MNDNSSKKESWKKDRNAWSQIKKQATGLYRLRQKGKDFIYCIFFLFALLDLPCRVGNYALCKKMQPLRVLLYIRGGRGGGSYWYICNCVEIWSLSERMDITAPGATITPLSCSPNLSCAQYLDIRTLTHELILELINNYSSSPTGLWVNSSWGRRPNGLLTQRPWGREE